MTHNAFRFGTTDTYITPIALGTLVFGTLTPEDEAHRILNHFITEVTPRYSAPDGKRALGMLDTADCYSWWEEKGSNGGHSEAVLGRWFASTGLRDAAFLATKGTATLDDPLAPWDGEDRADWSVVEAHFVGASPAALRTSLTTSLERLQTDKVDLYYNHVDDRRTPLLDSVGTLASFVAEGKIGAYGWSNVTTWRLAQIRAVAEANGWPQPISLQQQHTYLNRKAGLRHNSIVGDEQLDYLATYPDLQLVAYSPILKSVYTKMDRRTADFGPMGNYIGPDADARFAAVDSVAKASGATGNQVVLAWMMASDSPRVLPLIGPRTFDQYLECIEALDVTLTEDQLQTLNEAGA